LVSVATQDRKQNREDANQSFREKHDALSATIGAARTNVTQLESEKRELIRQGFSASDNEVKEVQSKIEAEQKREQGAIDEMHPRERVKAQTPTAHPGNPNNTSSTPQTFSIGAWKKANPKGDVDAAKAEAKRRGYNVVN
jgi:gas vesicle protein